MLLRSQLLASSVTLMALAFSPTARADRHFTFLYESYTEAPGVIESENQVFGRVAPVDGKRSFGVDVFNELEFGLAKNFQLGIYYANRSYRDGRSEGEPRGARYGGVALEPKLRLWSQAEGKPVGVAVLGEVAVGRRFLGLESRLIVDRRVGKWQGAYNFIVESEWEDRGLRARTVTLGQSAGLRYDLTATFSAGAELRYEVAFPNQGEPTTHTVYLGPTLGYDQERFYVTATPAVQLTSVREEPRFFPRVIVGLKF